MKTVLVLSLVIAAIILILTLTLAPSTLAPSTVAPSTAFKAQDSQPQVIILSLQHRQQDYGQPLVQRLKKEGWSTKVFTAINGKEIEMATYRPLMTHRYQKFFDDNRRAFTQGETENDYRGHLGATLSHRSILQQKVQGVTVILEDDADLVSNFGSHLTQKLETVSQLEPQWDLLLLGWSCNYNDHYYHKLNDYEPILKGGLVRLHYWIGLWGYVVRDATVATKILKLTTPMTWHIDLMLAELARQGTLKVYGTFPPLALHPGKLRLSSWDYTQVGRRPLRTDTNR